MKDENGNKFYTDNEKCNLMEKTWKDVFEITEDGENSFDREHSEHIDRYIDLFSDRVNPFPIANTTRIMKIT